MADFCTCGAQLPPDARFCHKCGKPQFDYPEIEVPPPVQAAIQPPPLPLTNEISFRNGTAVRISFIAALLAIFVMLPGPQFLPVPRLIVVFFLAGLFSTMWYKRRTGQNISMRSGARIGWLTGIFSFAILVTMVTVSMLMISAEGGLSAIGKQLPNHDPNFDQAIKMLSDPSAAVSVILFGLVFLFVLFTTLPMIGGAVGAKLSEKRA